MLDENGLESKRLLFYFGLLDDYTEKVPSIDWLEGQVLEKQEIHVKHLGHFNDCTWQIPEKVPSIIGVCSELIGNCCLTRQAAMLVNQICLKISNYLAKQ